MIYFSTHLVTERFKKRTMIYDLRTLVNYKESQLQRKIIYFN